MTSGKVTRARSASGASLIAAFAAMTVVLAPAASAQAAYVIDRGADVEDRHLRPDVVLELELTREGAVRLLVRYRVRRGEKPRTTTLCVTPGGRPSAC